MLLRRHYKKPVEPTVEKDNVTKSEDINPKKSPKKATAKTNKKGKDGD